VRTFTFSEKFTQQEILYSVRTYTQWYICENFNYRFGVPTLLWDGWVSVGVSY